MKSTIHLFNAGLNADDDFSVVQNGQWVNGLNMRVGTTDKGATGRLEGVGGTVSIANTLPTGTNKSYGGCEDKAGNRLVWFNYNSNGDHAIYCLKAGVIYTVITQAQVTGGIGLIENNYIHSCGVVNGILYWTNGVTDPFKINIDAAIKLNHPSYVTDEVAYTSPLAKSVVALIRKQPPLAPIPAKYEQTLPALTNNFIKDNAFQFCYRFKYRDYEESTLSTHSVAINFNTPEDKFNRVDIEIPLDVVIEQDVVQVDLVAKYLSSGRYFIIKSWKESSSADLLELTGHRDGVSALNYKFYNDRMGIALDPAYSVKPFDSVPLSAKTIEFARNRAFLGGCKLGYDTPTNLPIGVPRMNLVDFEDSTITQLRGEWFLLAFKTGASNRTTYVFKTTQPIGVTVLSASPEYYYTLDSLAASPPFAATVNETDLRFCGRNIREAAELMQAYNDWGHPSNLSNISMAPMAAYSTIVLATFSDVKTIVNLRFMFKLPGIGGAWLDYNVKAIRSATGIGVRPAHVANQYYYTYPDIGAPYLTTIAETGLTYIGRKTTDDFFPQSFYTNIRRIYNVPSSYPVNVGVIETVEADTITVTGYVLNNEPIQKVFKSDSPYQLSLTYYDEFGRGCGYLTHPNLIFNTPDTGLNDNTFAASVTWNIFTLDAAADIPDWAHYYSINITKNLRTRWFIQSLGTITYCTKDPATEEYAIGSTGYDSIQAGVAVDLTFLQSASYGYSYQEGDVIKVYVNGEMQSLSIIDTQGSFVICELRDIGTLGTVAPFEIYTPYTPADQELFYECGQKYAIIDPTLSTRSFSTITGVIEGDVYLFRRNTNLNNFIAEAMSPSKKIWNVWHTDAGRAKAIDEIGQTNQTTAFVFSNVYIPGTKVNGLSSFDTLNIEVLGEENGPIQRLKLSSKVQEDGTVMLAICAFETSSIYLGEQELFDTQGSAFLARASGVVGTVKALRGSFGTMNPESVIEHNGLIYWWDTRNGTAIQYSVNGLFPISEYKFKRPSNLFSKKMDSLTKSEIAALGGFPFIIPGYDPHHNELYFSIPTVENTPPKGIVADVNRVYFYDVYDGLGKTLVYKPQINAWGMPYSWQPECYMRLGSDLYSVKAGVLFKHNTDSIGYFYGAQNFALISFTCTPGGVNTYLSVGVEGNKKPTQAFFRTESPYEQSTILDEMHFDTKEGIHYASIMRDRLSPNTDGSYDEKQIKGDRLFGDTLLVTLEMALSTETYIRTVAIGHVLNQGHLVLKS